MCTAPSASAWRTVAPDVLAAAFGDTFDLYDGYAALVAELRDQCGKRPPDRLSRHNPAQLLRRHQLRRGIEPGSGAARVHKGEGRGVDGREGGAEEEAVVHCAQDSAAQQNEWECLIFQ